MTAKASIIAAISTRVGNTAYSAWRIGLTHDTAERKTYWGTTKGQTVSCWTSWTADSLSEAQAIETYFIQDKGMKGGEGGNLSPGKTAYVYIF
jgi:hypothetical protein